MFEPVATVFDPRHGPGGTFLLLLAIAALSLLLTLLARRYALRSNLIDMPGARRSHQVPTPRGGGIGIITALLAGWLLLLALQPAATALWALVTGTGVIAAIGWWDDHRPLRARWRALVQLTACAGFLLATGGIHTLYITADTAVAGWWWNPLAVLGMIWMVNLYNFMDGSDGMAASQGVISGLLLALLAAISGQWGLALVAASVAASCCGFLPLNLPRARIFMGDVASGALGFVFAALIVINLQHNHLPGLVPLMALSVFIVDSTATLVMRVYQRKQWYTAHKEHAYQRLISHGWSHSAVLLSYVLVNLIIVAPLTVLAVISRSGRDAGLLVILCFAVLLAIWITVTIKRDVPEKQ